MSSAPVFALDRVGFAYDPARPVLRELSFAIAPGERIAVLGANGSGKSTLLKLLDGLLVAQLGTVRFLGQALTDAVLDGAEFARQFRSRVGLVFQRSEVQLFSSTVWEDVVFGPLQMGLPPAEVSRRAEDVLRLLRIDALRDRSSEQLSGGEQKRVAIAAVLACNPDVILLDEPTANLDPRSRWELVDVLADLQAAGKTLMTATNDLEIVPEIAERVIVLGEHSALLADGPAKTILLDQPLLEQANLIHIHRHRHPGGPHRHPHQHVPTWSEHHTSEKQP